MSSKSNHLGEHFGLIRGGLGSDFELVFVFYVVWGGLSKAFENLFKGLAATHVRAPFKELLVAPQRDKKVAPLELQRSSKGTKKEENQK